MWEVMLHPQEGQCSLGVLQMKPVLHLILWVGDVPLVLKAAKAPFLTDLFLCYTLSLLGWSRYHSREVSAFPSCPVILSTPLSLPPLT